MINHRLGMILIVFMFGVSTGFFIAILGVTLL